MEERHLLRCLLCRRNTSYEMRISDWSSDVCSSDLGKGQRKSFRWATREGDDHEEAQRHAERVGKVAHSYRGNLVAHGADYPKAVTATLWLANRQAAVRRIPPNPPSPPMFHHDRNGVREGQSGEVRLDLGWNG